jgi:hypothetical protein
MLLAGWIGSAYAQDQQVFGNLRVDGTLSVGTGGTPPTVGGQLTASGNTIYNFKSNHASNTAYMFLENAGVTGGFNTVGFGSVSNHLILRAGSAERVRVTADGKLGIGTTIPIAGVHAISSNSNAAIFDSTASSSWIWLDNSTNSAYNSVGIASLGNNLLYRAGGAERMRLTDTGRLGIGTTNPSTPLEVVGEAKMSVVNITGGSDFSEKFDIHGDTKAEPGTVVCIDPASPGKLVVSSSPYDRTVAGIVSGAGGIKSGMVMGQLDHTLASGELPVALSGRVYCQADVSGGPIRPGDLLTTSDRPGYAMKVTDHVKAQGAILGKAMTSLDEGKGLVLVLVSLQ